MANAEFKISKPSLLIEACRSIEAMKISSQNQDVQGDLYEYLLSKLNTAGTNGQFRTPRHIIRMMVKMVDPQPGERIVDPAAGTCGFLVNAWQHILETYTDPLDLAYDQDGWAHGLTGARLSSKQWNFEQDYGLTGYDSDSGMTMLRLGSMNLILHGITSPHFHYSDTLSKRFTEERAYDIVLANPPFKGAIDASDVNPTLPTKVKRTEILFLHLFLRLLENGGRAAVIVPDGILFGATKAHVEIRRQLIEQNRLDAVISMPSGVFRPYAGVSAAVLLFTKGASTEYVWFYDMEHDGFSLDDKRLRVSDNDLPDILASWAKRWNAEFQQQRAQRLSQLRNELQPLAASRRDHQAVIHRLRFEEALAAEPEAAEAARATAEAELEALERQIRPYADEISQLSRQFWVSKEQLVANAYDLSANRYRNRYEEDEYYEDPTVTLDRLGQLEPVITSSVSTLRKLVQDR